MRFWSLFSIIETSGFFLSGSEVLPPPLIFIIATDQAYFRVPDLFEYKADVLKQNILLSLLSIEEMFTKIKQSQALAKTNYTYKTP